MERIEFERNLRWWGFYVVMNVICHVSLSSVGAFFHFLLGHQISLVEGWLHKNGWELAVVAKVFALWALHRLLRVRLYNPRGAKDFFQHWRWPDQRAVVVAVFLNLAFFTLSPPLSQSQNHSYWPYQLMAFVGTGLWFLSDYFAAAILQDLFPVTRRFHKRWRLVVYVVSFWVAFRLVVPDYFHTAWVMHLHLISLLLLTGNHLQQWGNAVSYVFLFAAPAAALFGVDPIWGADFSPFKLQRLPGLPFLLGIWMLSLAYYRYRHRWRWPFPLS